MAQNLKLDPVKRDYVVENGSPVPSDRVLEATYYALAIPQGKWIYGELKQGSLLYTLSGIKRTAAIEQLFASYARDAVKRQVIDTGQATDVGIKNLSQSTTTSGNQIEVVPSQVQLSNSLGFNPVR